MNWIRSRPLLLPGLLALASVVAVCLLPRLPQDPAYHRFADQRSWLGIPNALDVLTNLPFLGVGIAGMWILLRRPEAGAFADKRERWPYLVFFGGAALVGLGSGYYHWAPENLRLVWDRLPMTVSFMGLLAVFISERIDVQAGWRCLPLLLALGVGSVGYWIWTEHRGVGDLRPYAWVQYFPLLVIPVLLAFYPTPYTRGLDFLGALGFYAGAKLVETFDRPIHGLGLGLSGHSLKHLLAATAVGWVLRMLIKRRRAQTG